MAEEKNSAAPSPRRVVVRAVTNVMNLGVAGTAVAAGAALHSWPIWAVGGAAYVALVAWDLVNPKFWKKHANAEDETDLPHPSSLKDTALREAMLGILAARVERARVLEELPDQVRAHLVVALASAKELEQRAARLVERGEAIHGYLETVKPDAVRREIDKLADKVARTRDAEARSQYESARKAREDQLKTYDDIADARERVVANLARIGATLEALPAKAIRMRALDAQAMDTMTGDLNQELEGINGEISSFEETMQSIVDMAKAV